MLYTFTIYKNNKTIFMKFTLLLPAVIAISVISFSSCKKASVAEDLTEIETTFDLASKGGIAENLTQDAQQVLSEAALENNIAGYGTQGSAGTEGVLGCATVTVTSLSATSAFPKNIVINFGTTGACRNRTGKINVVLTDSLRKSGSIATMTFTDYIVGNYKKEGTITWTNTSTATVKSWNRNCVGGKITNVTNNNFWLHEGQQTMVQTEGNNTALVFDDVFSITGSRTTTNSANVTRVGTILTALQKKTICDNIDKGTYKIQGPNHVAVINFGDGTCDNIATISIDGRPERTFLLR
jgi:hypothetical protein